METEDATNPAAEDEIVSAEGVADEAQAQGDEDLSEEGAQEGQPDDDSEEIDHDGQKYRIPKALKPALMMQADYTRKTQEVAEQRRALEAERAQHTQSFEALKADYGKVHALETQVQALSQIDWAAYQAQDPDAARVHYDQFRLLKDQLRDAQDELQTKENQRLQGQREQTAKAWEETRGVLARDIKGWSPQLAADLVAMAGDFGISQSDLADPDPRPWKLLAEVKSLREALKKQAVTQRQQAATSVQPARTVSAKSTPPIGLDDRLGMDEWLKRRNAQLAKR